MIRLLRQIFSRAITYYGIIACLIVSSVNFEKAQFERVNHLQEAASYPVLFLNNQAPYDKARFRLAKKYYENFVNMLRYYEQSDFINIPVAKSRAYTMIAICEYYTGHSDKAIKLLRQAQNFEPRHFWLNYNLGFIHYKRGEYAAALGYFRESFGLTSRDVEESMVLDYYRFWPWDFAQQYRELNFMTFRDVRGNSVVLAILSCERLKKPELAKQLAGLGIKYGLGEEASFLKYYAGLSQERPVDKTGRYGLMYNPSLNIIPIGQEKYVIEKYRTQRGHP